MRVLVSHHLPHAVSPLVAVDACAAVPSVAFEPARRRPGVGVPRVSNFVSRIRSAEEEDVSLFVSRVAVDASSVSEVT